MVLLKIGIEKGEYKMYSPFLETESFKIATRKLLLELCTMYIDTYIKKEGSPPIKVSISENDEAEITYSIDKDASIILEARGDKKILFLMVVIAMEIFFQELENFDDETVKKEEELMKQQEEEFKQLKENPAITLPTGDKILNERFSIDKDGNLIISINNETIKILKSVFDFIKE